MALMFAIDSFQGWEDAAQKQAFVKHLLGDVPVAASGTATSAYDKMTVQELKEECKSKGIKGITQKKRAELLELLKQGPQIKSKKDKTKAVVLDKNFYKAEFVEKFREDPNTIKVSELKKAVGKKGFDIADQLPPVERKDGKVMENTAFGAKKENMIEILTSHLEDIDIEELKAEDAEKKAVEKSNVSEVSSAESSDAEISSSDEEVEKEAAKAEKKPVKAEKMAKAEKKAVKEFEKCEVADSSDDDEPLGAVAAKAAPEPETKKKKRSKARRKEVSDLPRADEFEPTPEDFHAE
tara:strand:+ start:263 stop:1147 length:885 start_codon:yes stop_codon:yes gene_type:complete